MSFDHRCIVLGAGAAGLMCAAHAGPGTLVLDHARAPGEKIRISGGGRCNFTNLHAGPENYLSENPHFAKSALARYTQLDFIDLLARHDVTWHEKTLGQLFCDGSAQEIVTLLLLEMERAGAGLRLKAHISEVDRLPGGFAVLLATGERLTTQRLVVATGGKSIPRMGASDFGHRLARQFGHQVTETRPALVPFTFTGPVLESLRSLAGVSAQARVTAGSATFEEAVLFTHRGLSGPAILQASSYWREGTEIVLDLLPRRDAEATLRSLRAKTPRKSPARALAALLPARLAAYLAGGFACNMADLSDRQLGALARTVAAWHLSPAGTEGYRTAEVTLGGVATDALDARNMESRIVPGLYFIGEVVDVTGWLGGFNFQWAWSSGWAAGAAIAQG
ncbi:hypothetical protein C8N32_102174 [Rhodovulum imhoffii]|uniref:NAD(P)/FAD-dependent oxidoreductase n=1 Tax=Rhodovulum imhoffii TaxID=365340 RepID=A0A2T5BVR2_9RHOB|nr:NAD(P)/FAD-dependent oxidoreductase [Rhodovulum imhoffii]MBK5932784.1 aminoacetone oxidase family FAD-binding enzyme [Rhodovulum imhoffii]PTN03647.1 hypothetical protein C8N32_102174 [Rhodovulum imhoffii]